MAGARVAYLAVDRMSASVSAERDPAFREHASGLLVPAELSRARTVRTHDEARLLARTVKLLASMGIEVFYGCQHADCRKAGPMQLVWRNDGGLTLRCAHRDLEFQAKG